MLVKSQSLVYFVYRLCRVTSEGNQVCYAARDDDVPVQIVLVASPEVQLELDIDLDHNA